MSFNNHDNDDPNRIRYVKKVDGVFLEKKITSNEILDIAKQFEKRNNLSVRIKLCTDGSGTLNEFWDNEVLFSYDCIDELKTYLEKTNYKLDKNGRCVSPIEIIKL